LIVTLSLMILLVLLAVGLLSLASITLRVSSQEEAMSTARANARLALMLALGELQQTAGPDQRVTARADIVAGTGRRPRLTGVWKSWEILATAPPSPADYEAGARDAKFQGWLVSSPDPLLTRQIESIQKPPGEPVTLWGTGSLGIKALPGDLVSAGKVRLPSSPGAFAWAVLDEGIKARINTCYSDEAASTAAKTLELGSGVRPGVEFISGLSGLDRQFFKRSMPQAAVIDKGISRLNFALATESLVPGMREALRPLTHDVTTHSLGLFTDTARGGLKQDVHTLMQTNKLPAIYQDKGVYVSRLGMTSSTAPSDPTWASLREFSRLYQDKIQPANGTWPAVLPAQTPAGWVPASLSGSVTTINRAPPPGVVLLPTIAKVQVLFSLIGRDLYDYPKPLPLAAMPEVPPDAPGFHGFQCDHFRGTKYKYDLQLMYTPVVTLHNPYNVALEFYNLRVEFVHTPFAMQVFRNGIAQSNGLVPVETMYIDNESGSAEKSFGMELKTKTSSGTPGSATFRLLPGEVKLFSPYIPPTHTYREEFRSGQKTWDWLVGSRLTQNITALPGWRGDGIGYSCDWLAGGQRVDGNKVEGRGEACLGLARDDKIHVEFAPLSVESSSRNKFVVRMIASPGSPTATPVIVNAIELDYESATGLQTFMGNNGVSMPIRYPKLDAVPNYLLGIDLVDHAETPVSEIKKLKPFALLSVQGKTTSALKDGSMEDGRLATKPWCFAHANIGASTQKVITEHSANFSHEFDLQLLDSGTDNLLQVDDQGCSNFIAGHGSDNGVKSGIQYDIPLAPIQTLAGLNGANPGGSSGYLPRFAQPIGNSWAHPLIASDRLLEERPAGNYLDHSFLLNLALYDGFYFSGLAGQTGPFCSPSRTTSELAEDFSAGKALDDPRLMFHAPDGRPAEELATEVGKSEVYAKVAGWQMMRGAFNINSTSVGAWKAMLASIHDSNAVFNQLDKAHNSSALHGLTEPASGVESRISRLRLPVSESAADGVDAKDAYWLGPREYSADELQTLAENIVEQVKARGPFLSMAEFVNRRLGSGDSAQRGALQQAIDDSGLNAGPAIAANAGFDIPVATVANYKYANAAAGAGPSYQGAPGYLSQADLLNVLGNAATARSDTFTVRGYGDARDAHGRVVARAMCEAIVQRFPEWLDPVDAVETPIQDLQSQVNKKFGRRFHIISFRWLSPLEI
jgi:hypothetical protein